MKNLITLGFVFLGIFTLAAQNDESQSDDVNESLSLKEMTRLIDSINTTFTYKRGVIQLGNGVANINVPDGYKYLDSEQSQVVLTDYWGNPPAETLGLLFPENSTIIGDDFIYAVEITYAKDGYIDDSDARDLDYDKLLEEIKEDTKLQSAERVEMGFDAMEFLGWASQPFYDDVTKKLHWAQEFKFENTEVNTLNYNIRVLGRKGYLNLNVIGDMPVLSKVKSDVNAILASVEFNEGYRYSDFNPDIDEVAAYGIGGLIAGKVLAKAGFFAVLLKFWKFIAIGAVALFAGFKKRIFGSKDA
ncbi:MAG: DUF2167 domain-containing protein [Flavobacteriaceae bacterium]|nr:DUF2167 domain-containing protein [Flavobacteriaceae bacterium]